MSLLGGEFQPIETGPFDHTDYLRRYVRNCLERAKRIATQGNSGPTSPEWNARYLRSAILTAQQMGISIPPEQQTKAAVVIKSNLDLSKE